MKQTEQTIVLTLPDDWYFKESITLLAPDGRANVIASSEPLDPSIDTKSYAEIQGNLLEAEFPGYSESSFEPIVIDGGHDAFLRRFEWTPPDGVRVAQVQLYFADSGRGYTATATTPVDQLPKYGLQLAEIVSQMIILRHTDHKGT